MTKVSLKTFEEICSQLRQAGRVECRTCHKPVERLRVALSTGDGFIVTAVCHGMRESRDMDAAYVEPEEAFAEVVAPWFHAPVASYGAVSAAARRERREIIGRRAR